ncbi:hypothetical protein COBT_000793 [Conglomerata obtusa]
MNANDLEMTIIRFKQEELIIFMMQEKYLKKEVLCTICRASMRLVCYNKCKDKKAWRCMNTTCKNYKEYMSIRLGSFFEGFKLDLLLIFRIIIKYATRQTRYSIKEYFKLPVRTIGKIFAKPVNVIPMINFEFNKLGGPG